VSEAPRRRWALGLALACLAWTAPCAARPAWRALAPGLDYALRSAGEGPAAPQVHAFRVDLRQATLQVADARRPPAREAETVEALRAEHHAWVAVNGGFFDERGRPLGLLVSGGQELNSLRRADWGVFFVRRGRAGLVHTKDWRRQPPPLGELEMALQVGPRVVVDGRPLKLKPQVARRTALGILGDGRVLVLASARGALESNALARWLAAPPAQGGFGCRQALMLDGGPSTQLAAQAGNFHLSVPGGWPVPNAVLVGQRPGAKAGRAGPPRRPGGRP